MNPAPKDLTRKTCPVTGAHGGIGMASAKAMVAAKKPGSIINLVSQSAALVLVEHNIRGNAISPGVVDTPMWDTADGLFAEYEGKENGPKKPEVEEAVPLGYIKRPCEIARVAVLLASDQSQDVTAQTLSVTGGNLLGM